MTETMKKRKTAAKKTANTGFYEAVLDEADKLDFEIASGVDGIDDEITLLRIKIKDYMKEHPDDIRLLMQATSMLARLVKINYNISKENKKGLSEKIYSVIKDLAIPLGISIIEKKIT